ncbi:MAG: GAF and ANTAR domain-containing protein [Acidimicrobiia bacterium]
MAGERRLRILTQLVGGGAFGLETKRLCEVCAEVTGMTGAGIMLMSGDVPSGAVCTTDNVSRLIEELQFTLGEGPCVDAYHQDRPVLEPDLAEPSAPRWMAFAVPAIAAGARAVFGFPLQVGAVRLGALNLYRDQPGPMSDEQHADALVMADVSAAAVLMMQANAPPEKVAVELESGSDFRYVVHQASGMVAVQLDVGIAQAMIRLRGYSFSSDRPLTEVARDVVARRLRFDA